MSFITTLPNDATDGTAVSISGQRLSGLLPYSWFEGTPTYANTWNEMVQLVWARANYNENKRLDTSGDEYVTKSQVGATVSSYNGLRAANKVPSPNPSNIGATNENVVAIQYDLGSEAPPPETIKIILRELYYGVTGTPQQIHPRWLVPESTLTKLTPNEQQAAQAAKAVAEQSQASAASEESDNKPCGFLCSIGRSFLNLVSLPGEVAGSISTTTRIASIAIPVVVIGGTAMLLYVIARKAMELNANKTAGAALRAGVTKGL
ncbi:MAG: hypothetical protein HYX66_08990 [Ignavibacteria bacterium]|nr:hypothetical protein [Ignavibacteria bacterium]